MVKKNTVYWYILQHDPSLNDTFKDPSLIAHKIGRHIRDITSTWVCIFFLNLNILLKCVEWGCALYVY